MIMCHQWRSMFNSISLSLSEIHTENKKERIKAPHVYLSAAIRSLATGLLGKYQQLTDIIYGHVLYPMSAVGPERSFKMKETNSEVSQRNFLQISIRRLFLISSCPVRLCDKMLAFKFQPKHFLEKEC